MLNDSSSSHCHFLISSLFYRWSSDRRSSFCSTFGGGTFHDHLDLLRRLDGDTGRPSSPEESCPALQGLRSAGPEERFRVQRRRSAMGRAPPLAAGDVRRERGQP